MGHACTSGAYQYSKTSEHFYLEIRQESIMAESKKTASDYVTRGILIGGAVGAFAALLGFTHSLFWGTGLGMLAGVFAGLTISKRVEKQNK